MAKSLFGLRTGSWGTPELGVTEFLGNLVGRPRDPVTGGSQVVTARPGTTPVVGYTPRPQVQGAQSSQNMSVAPRSTAVSGGGGGGAAAPSANFEVPYSGGNEADERARVEAEQGRIRAGIDEAYSPIFASLDERIGLVGPQRDEFLAGVESLITPQRGLVESERMKGVRGLEAAKSEEEGLAKSAIRDLETDVRNQLKSAGAYFGSLGAGDSSATGLASEAITRASLQARGKVREGLIKAMATIDSKVADVNSLASDQLLKIEQWKGGQVQSIKSFFLDRLDQLENAKMGAQGSRAAAIANMISNTEQEYVNRLRKLDDDAFSFKNSIATWQAQRQADLSDFQTKLAMQAQYGGTSGSGATYTKALQDFNRLNQTLGAEEARKTIMDQYGIDPLGGVTLTGADATRRAESPFAELERGVASSLSSTGAERTGINLGPLRISI